METFIENVNIDNKLQCKATVEVLATSKSGIEERFYVQTINGKFRKDLNCIVYSVDSAINTEKHDKIFNADKIIKSAEQHLLEIGIISFIRNEIGTLN